MQNNMTLDEIKQKLFKHIISCEFATYECWYAPDCAVVPILTLMSFEPGISKYKMRKALKELIAEGVIEYTTQGRPAIESIGEYRELVCEAAPPINGYALTKAGFDSDEYKEYSEQRDRAYRRMCDDHDTI